MYVTCEHITKKIKGNTILNDITISFEKGQVHGIRGYNGSGKTMLLRAIAGLIKLTEGQVIVNEKIVGKDRPFPESVGVLIENPSFIPDYSGFNNLLFLTKINHMIGVEEVKKNIELVGLNPNDKRKFKKYSLGMKQRLGIAQAIMENPELLLLDEPTNGLDERGILLLIDIIKRLKVEGKTIIITSHDRDFLEHVSDNMYNLAEGILKNV